MADSLAVDTAALTKGGAALVHVTHAFHVANVDARGRDAAIGYDALAGAVAGFAMEWDEIRIGMIKDITFLGEACTRIGTTLEKLDADLAAKVRATP